MPELAANFAWGDADGRTLYMTACTGLYRVRLGIPGAARGAPGRAAHCGGAATVGHALPTFGPDGTRVGDPRALLLDWSRFPHEYIEGPGAAAALHRGLDALPSRDRAALLVDTEGLALADVAQALGEPARQVRRRLHRARMFLRECLTEYFVAATTPH
jgi:hypothetical protein